jgi:alkylation response protein AidB-like acyl-CoA dehydrogenase
MSELLRERDIEFLLYEFLDTASLLERDRYRDHSLEIFRATIEAARDIAETRLLPNYQKGDENEPQFDGKAVKVIPQTREVWDVIRKSGFLKAAADTEDGGLQLPEVILRASEAYFLAADPGTTAYAFLTWGVINLLRSFGSAEQKALYLPLLLEGEASGTMALTEPGQGSSLADIRTRAEPLPDGSWRIFGQKMFITAGDHDLTDNIIHMVLAKTRREGGVHGISLFIVPKFMVGPDGRPGARNDVALAGLLHKMGWRNATSAVLNFGEKDGAVGYLIGGEGRGLACMFQMMNEARIGVGMGAAALAVRGFLYSLQYAKERVQGRLPSNKNPVSPQVRLIDHADVRRMLLAQKAYGEGALALCLYATSLFEDEHTLPDAAARKRAGELLSLLTPVVKSWSSRYGCQANDLAIQVLGGAGYIREHPLEQIYRDQRLNPIHEGAEAIHGLDILGRKVRQSEGIALVHFEREIQATVEQCAGHAVLEPMAVEVKRHLALLLETTRSLVGSAGQDIDMDAALANATLYLDAFGRVTIAWIWLRQASVAQQALEAGAASTDRDFYEGKVQAARYYVEWELPAIEQTCALLAKPNLLPLHTRAACL